MNHASHSRTPRTVVIARAITRAALGASLALTGCGGEPTPPVYETFEEACAAVDGCGETRFPGPGTSEPIYRLEIARDAEGAVRIGAIDRVDVPEGVGVPVGPGRGAYLAAARDATGAPLDGQVVAFPETLFVESLDHRALHQEVALDGREVDTIAYVRALPDAVDVAVLTLDGEVLTSAPLPEPEPDDAEVGRSEAALIAASAACAHVMLVDGPSDRDAVPNVAYVDGEAASGFGAVELLSPGPMQRAAVDATLGLMPPLLCHTISRIVFGRVPGALELRGAVAVAGGGDTILINVNYLDDTPGAPTTAPLSEAGLAHPASRALLARILFHEAGHSVAALLNAHGSRPGVAAGAWVPAARTLAEETIAHVRLEGGLSAEWLRMHGSFVEHGWADPHAFEDARRDWSAERTTHAGAMSRYGATSEGDDFCEMIAWPATAPLYAAAGIPEGRNLREDYGCQTLRAYSGSDLPATLAAVYTKLRFLQDLGLIAEADLESCVGTGLMLGDHGPGLHFRQGGPVLRSYTEALDGGLYTVSDGVRPEHDVFHVQADGGVSFGDAEHAATASLTLELRTAGGDRELTSWPRGIYRISPLTPHAFALEVPEEPAASFGVTDGFALVWRGSGSLVEGSVFITEAMRWDAPVPVPQVFDPPLIVSFRYE